MIALKPSFSYANNHAIEERFARNVNKNKVEDNELGIFEAEKYFKGVIDEERLKTSNHGVHCGSNRPQDKHEEPCPMPKPKPPSSVRSESSWNSRRGLLVSNGLNGSNNTKKISVKSLLASLGCKCSDKGSVKITEAKQPVKGGDSGQKTKPLSSKRAGEDVTIKREDCFTFPVLNPSTADVKLIKLPEVKREKGCLETKLTMFNWDGVAPRAENNDTGSDRSSDLFELESFSTNENSMFLAQQETENMFLAQQETENNMYEPSEASVDWSVVTASMADFSTPEDLVVKRNVKGSGILSGCTSLKAVRVSGDEHRVTGGGVSLARQEWCSRFDSTTPVAKIQANTKLICSGSGSGLHISQKGFDLARTHASSYLYRKQ
ncbi:hypothetical protein R6Q59_012023 [Mikania micrantha]|uniref:Protein PHYTOCHROME KINASE SUBSTRATE 1-like n=1 Tax=Mikania micrantha TaxID=192012 RepID=A0A5N6LQK1_9ASTR|nr:hypothetical protein E3N88_40655 [Mikania micrantha]